MTLTIELNPSEVSRLNSAALTQGIPPAQFARRLVVEHLPTPEETTAIDEAPVIDEKNRAAIALLNQWLVEDATDDPDEIAQAEADLAELMCNMNANRAATGERLVFP